MNEILKIVEIAKYTFVEIYKGKIFYILLILGITLVLLTYIASEFAYGVPARIALDFGLGSLYLSSSGIALFLGATLISREIESRTVYMILSRPLTRTSFLLGRILGMLGIIFVNNIVLAGLTLTIYFLMNGDYQSLILWCIFFSILESTTVLLIVILFSLISNVIITFLSTLVIYIIGHAITDAMALPLVKDNVFINIIVKSYAFIFPDFSKLNIKNFVLYQQHLETGYLFSTLLYVLIYCVMLIVVSSVLFERKNLD